MGLGVVLGAHSCHEGSRFRVYGLGFPVQGLDFSSHLPRGVDVPLRSPPSAACANPPCVCIYECNPNRVCQPFLCVCVFVCVCVCVCVLGSGFRVHGLHHKGSCARMPGQHTSRPGKHASAPCWTPERARRVGIRCKHKAEQAGRGELQHACEGGWRPALMRGTSHGIWLLSASQSTHRLGAVLLLVFLLLEGHLVAHIRPRRQRLYVRQR